MDADAALSRWLSPRRRALETIALRGTYLDGEDVRGMLGLTLPGVDELIGLIELRRLAEAASPDEVLVDAAPTGHMLRLLQMPETLGQIARVLDQMEGKHRYLTKSLGGILRHDEAEALIEELAAEARTLRGLLADKERTTVTWVLLPEALALHETGDGIAELARGGIAVADVVLNRLTPPPPGRCTLCDGRRRAEAVVVAAARTAFAAHPLHALPALDREPRGVPALRKVAAATRLLPRARPTRARARVPAPRERRGGTHTRASTPPPPWLAAVAPEGTQVVLVAGKGGVGKTSSAAVVADALSCSRRVLLLSADPAHSLGDVLAIPLGDDERAVPGAPSLVAREIDAGEAFATVRVRFREKVDAVFDRLRGGSALDASFDRAVVREMMDLAPPGLDELFAMVALTSAIGRTGADAPQAVVLDSAPTGHALRLLALPDVARDWAQALLRVLLKYRPVVGLGDVAEELVAFARDLRLLAALLRDPRRTAVVVVSRPAELPARETGRLLRELGRLGMEARALLLNAVTPPGCARCRRASAREAEYLTLDRRRQRALTPRVQARILAPAVAPPPRGLAELRAWAASWTLERDDQGTPGQARARPARGAGHVRVLRGGRRA